MGPWLACGWVVGVLVRNFSLQWVNQGMNNQPMVRRYHFQSLGPGVYMSI